MDDSVDQIALQWCVLLRPKHRAVLAEHGYQVQHCATARRQLGLRRESLVCWELPALRSRNPTLPSFTHPPTHHPPLPSILFSLLFFSFFFLKIVFWALTRPGATKARAAELCLLAARVDQQSDGEGLVAKQEREERHVWNSLAKEPSTPSSP
jgi:hypothetical protein